MPVPEKIRSTDELDDALSTPSKALIDFASTLEGLVLVLGAGGKMGPSLCARLRRAITAGGGSAAVVAVSRFSNPESRSWLSEHGVGTIPCDLMDRSAVAALPDAANVIYLVGQKFGTSDRPDKTWAINTIVPGLVMDHFRSARIVALSTGNVYPLTPIDRGAPSKPTIRVPLVNTQTPAWPESVFLNTTRVRTARRSH